MQHEPRSIVYNVVLYSIVIGIAFTIVPTCLAQSTDAVDVKIITDQADAVLAILAKRRTNQPIAEADWQRLFSSEGYLRLKKREIAFQQPFDDGEFKSFVLSDNLKEREQALAETLAKWRQTDATGAARLALTYLPAAAHIRAKIYPVIKPRENSFVFEVSSDPAIFLYIDPTITKEQFQNTLAHELHHIGYGSGCSAKQVSEEIAKLPENIQNVLKWIGAFGEGFAMLAAAGGPDIHPHNVSKPEDRSRWDNDIANFNSDLKRVEEFFLKILDGKLTAEERNKMGFEFFGIQGPWYTVGWKMAVVIEKVYGRAKLIESFCDRRKLLSLYNEAAKKYRDSSSESLVIWSPALIERMEKSNK
ncbi:MAG: DUF5700 domain-containing putative Zn-dependent protease [Acidobacteriota bacterium]